MKTKLRVRGLRERVAPNFDKAARKWGPVQAGRHAHALGSQTTS